MTSPQQEENLKIEQKIGLVQKLALPYYASCLQFLVIWAIYLHTNEPAYILAFVVIFPYLGKLLPRDSYPVTHSTQHNKNIFQVFPLVANILFTWITMGKLFLDYPISNYTTIQVWQTVVVLILTITPSIDASHELIHRPQWAFRVIGFVNMALFQFTVYPIEHLYLHHKYVGTDKDPITSPKNQTLYMYTIKAFFSAHKFVFNYSIKAFAVCMLTNWLYLGILFFHAFRELGDAQMACWRVVFFMGVGMGCFSFLQIIEYIEHYGLVYREDVDKKEINEISSWNSEENILYNWIIFRFQRHSDHHMNAYKIFTTLELTDKMPRFPFNFFEGGLISLFPPLWYYIMNPYVDEVMEKKPIQKTHRTIVKFIKQGLTFAIVLIAIFQAYSAYQLRSLA